MRFDLYLVALGNDGEKYLLTRHNIGFRFAEHIKNLSNSARPLNPFRLQEFADSWACEIEGREMLVVQPRTYMNNSGDALRALLRDFSIETETQLFLVYDDLDLDLGMIRLRKKGSAGTHKGMASVLAAIGHGNFPRLRFGIGPKPAAEKAQDFVLKPFHREEEPVVAAMLDKAGLLWQNILTQGLDRAISKFQDARISGGVQRRT